VEPDLFADLGRNFAEERFGAGGDGVACAGGGDAVAEAAVDAERAGAGGGVRRQDLRQQEIGAIERGQLEIFGKHADDPDRLAIEREEAA
jgi:hypothetical protein